MVTASKERTKETLERLKEDLPDVFSMEWLDAHREDVAQALEELGATAVSRSLGISVNSLNSWRRRRGLSGRRGRDATAPGPGPGPADGGELIDLELIDDNPWQPRKTTDPEYLQGLATSIHTSGLLQMPIGRRQPDGRAQLAFGHQRVAAIRLLADQGKWQGGAPVVLKDLSDTQMALFALEENAKRKDISPLEQYRGYQKVIDDGLMNVTELADSVGLARSTVANNLRLLKLPKEALEHFRNGDLKAHAARELLALTAPDHDHKDAILAVIKSIEKMGSYYGGGAPDWSIKSVRRRIQEQVSQGLSARAWRPLWAGKPNRGGYVNHGGGAYAPPTCDVKAFAKEHPTRVHHIPDGVKDSRTWTCHVREWQRLQSAATRAETKATQDPVKAAAVGSLSKDVETAYLKALAHDPVVRKVQVGEALESAPASVSVETPPATEPDEKGAEYRLLNEWAAQVLADPDGELETADLSADAAREALNLHVLTDDEIERALERALEDVGEEEEDAEDAGSDVPELGQTAAPGWEDMQAQLGSRAGFLQLHKRRPSFVKRLEPHSLPAGFDLEMCRENCTWGAVYGQEYSASSSTSLYCTNRQHFGLMVEEGKARWAEACRRQMEKEDEEDLQTALALAAADTPTLLRQLVLALMVEQGRHQLAKPAGWDRRDLWRERGTTARVRDLVGMEAREGSGEVRFVPSYHGLLDHRVGTRVNSLDAAELQTLAANLVAYTVRDRTEDGDDGPPPAKGTDGFPGWVRDSDGNEDQD